jgi:hypothetical protein
MRVLHLGGTSWLGLVDDDIFVGDESSAKRRVGPDELVGLLPCLERPYAAVEAELREREQELSLPSGFLATRLRLTSIPAAAVDSRMAYWVDLALDWLEAFPEQSVDADLPVTIEQATWASQRARHRARSLRRRAGN